MSANRPAAFIVGCHGSELGADEAALFAKINPLGFILFKRNCRSPETIRQLTADLRRSIGREDAPILIDQEGGRVSRLAGPNWPRRPAAKHFGDLAVADPTQAAAAAFDNGRDIGAELAALGITVNCAPVLDLGRPETSTAIGDRAYSDRPDIVAALGGATCDGLLASGVLPVIKHIPGHGRARVDSHVELPVVGAALEILQKTDFVPFRALASMPLAMTAHIIFSAIDPNWPATQSSLVIEQIIRGELGFDGLLLSDDISMQALSGSLTDRAERTWSAGCDVVLHCTGNIDEAAALAAVAPRMTDRAMAAWARATQAVAS